MTHVEIGYNAATGSGSLKVDGVDLSMDVTRDGVKVDFASDPPAVHVVIWPTTLDIDLPEAMLAAARVSHDEDEDEDAEPGAFVRLLASINEKLDAAEAAGKRLNARIDDLSKKATGDAVNAAVRKGRRRS